MTIQLFVSDPAVLSSLEFSLAVEGFSAYDGEGATQDWSTVAAAVIDRGPLSESLARLAALRDAGCNAAMIVLGSHPNGRQRAQVAAVGAVLIEKPLLGDELPGALRAALSFEKAA